MKRPCFALCTLLGLILAAEEYCHDIENRCNSHLRCGNALHNFQLVCGRQLAGETNECTEECQRALITLVSRDDGYEYINCDCKKHRGKYSDCDERKQNLQVCKSALDAVDRNNDPSKPISCSIALWICVTDSECSSALVYYKSHCGNLKEIGSCPERCNTTINILYQQKYALKLQNCICDELLEDFNCYELQQNTKEYCFKNRYSIVNNNKRSPYMARDESTGNRSEGRWFAFWIVVTTILLWRLEC
ncbi:growth arrest-specific protein 1 homolog [Saccostrea echinata]|uniref:growth arrest-specific protein 1 homolog n=1 Tax=Saccostrea echinata TaxID=191078 RepID=UPI002A7FF1D6|nr:growth arrest-specific protein 1 homolog [Saccostrea echinata]